MAGAHQLAQVHLGFRSACSNGSMDTLTTGDGLKLHLQRWPATGPVLGTLQIVHGLGEHIGLYENLALALNALGWHVNGHDQRGHGLSEGPRGGIASSQALLTDLSAVIDHLRGSSLGPHILLGHSLGGLVAARFAAESLMSRPRRWAREIDGLVLSSPALEPRLNWPQRLLLRVLMPLAPNLGLGNGLKPRWISRDPEVVRRYVEDPLVHKRVTPRLVRFIVDEGRRVHAGASRWHTPTLLMWAGADRCVEPAGSVAFAAAVPSEVLIAQEFPTLFHEIFNEPEREQVIARLTTWLERFHAAS